MGGKGKNNSHFTGHHSSHSTNMYNPPYYYSYIYAKEEQKKEELATETQGVSEHNIFITC
jgi:hypothetical protein